MNYLLGLDQISAGFNGFINDFDVDGPGVWIGEMSITGIVPPIIDTSVDKSYSF